MSERPFRILLVEDNEINRQVLTIGLENEGFQVISARDGAAALQRLEAETIDLVLLDIMMPGITGLEVLEKLRQRYSSVDLPVIMVTSMDESEDVVKALDLGANDYVTKPLDLPVLMVRAQAQLRAKMPAGGLVQEPVVRTEAGAILDGKYRLESLIGHGSHGSVYRATHLQLDRQVAVKVLRTEASNGGVTLARFRQEGISACRIQHPNAVSVRDFGVSVDNRPYLVMELLSGGTLEEELRKCGRLSPERCAQILYPICDVLSEAHRFGVIHRDVKPQNIFLHESRQGEIVKVLDFGIAKLVGEQITEHKLTLEDGVPGTPAYIAPERLSDKPYDGRSDVYSLGVVLYEMLVGRVPFFSKNLVKIVMMHVNDTPRPPRALCPELSPEIEAVVLQALEKDRERRPSAQELARRFLAAIEMSPPSQLVARRPPVMGASLVENDVEREQEGRSTTLADVWRQS